MKIRKCWIRGSQRESEGGITCVCLFPVGVTPGRKWRDRVRSDGAKIWFESSQKFEDSSIFISFSIYYRASYFYLTYNNSFRQDVVYDDWRWGGLVYDDWWWGRFQVEIDTEREIDLKALPGYSYTIDKTWEGSPVTHEPFSFEMKWHFQKIPGRPHKRVVTIEFEVSFTLSFFQIGFRDHFSMIQNRKIRPASLLGQVV